MRGATRVIYSTPLTGLSIVKANSYQTSDEGIHQASRNSHSKQTRGSAKAQLGCAQFKGVQTVGKRHGALLAPLPTPGCLPQRSANGRVGREAGRVRICMGPKQASAPIRPERVGRVADPPRTEMWNTPPLPLPLPKDGGRFRRHAATVPSRASREPQRP